MKLLRFALILAVCAYISGCTFAAKKEGIVYRETPGAYPELLRNNLLLGDISGGKSTIPFLFPQIGHSAFANAMEESLSSQGLLSEDGAYRLDIEILKLEQPLFTLSATAAIYVRYKLTDVMSNEIVLDKPIIARHKTGMHEALTEATRRRLAVEGAARAISKRFLMNCPGWISFRNEVLHRSQAPASQSSRAMNPYAGASVPKAVKAEPHRIEED